MPYEPASMNADSATLRVSLPVGDILTTPMNILVAVARHTGGELLRFSYHEPCDPAAPDEERPLRYARLMIEDLPGPPDPAPHAAVRRLSEAEAAHGLYPREVATPGA